MAVTWRIRPVLIGDPARPAGVFYLQEREDGSSILRDREIPWPLRASLEAATVDDLPAFYRAQGLRMTLLPVQEITAESALQAWERLDRMLDHLSTRGAPRQPQERLPLRRQPRRARRAG